MILSFAVTFVVKPLFHQNSLNSCPSLFFNYFDKNTINSSHHPWPSGCISSCQHVNKHTTGCVLIDFVNIKIQFIKRFALSDSSEIWIIFAMLILTFNEKEYFGVLSFCSPLPRTCHPRMWVNYQNYFFLFSMAEALTLIPSQKEMTCISKGGSFSQRRNTQVCIEKIYMRFLLLTPKFGKIHNPLIVRIPCFKWKRRWWQKRTLFLQSRNFCFDSTFTADAHLVSLALNLLFKT